MFNALMALATIGGILLISESLWRFSKLKGESSRKFVHIVAGTYIAFLPFILSYNWIMVFGLGFIIINLLNRYTPVFHAINTIRRRSWGDVLFGVSVIICAALNPPIWLFTAAILHVSLADGLAALIGSKYAKNPYRILGYKKSFIGSASFALTSLLILIFTGQFGQLGIFYDMKMLIMILPLTMALIENISGYGSDNITLPLGVMVLFGLMQF